MSRHLSRDPAPITSCLQMSTHLFICHPPPSKQSFFWLVHIIVADLIWVLCMKEQIMQSVQFQCCCFKVVLTSHHVAHVTLGTVHEYGTVGYLVMERSYGGRIYIWSMFDIRRGVESCSCFLQIVNAEPVNCPCSSASFHLTLRPHPSLVNSPYPFLFGCGLLPNLLEDIWGVSCLFCNLFFVLFFLSFFFSYLLFVYLPICYCIHSCVQFLDFFFILLVLDLYILYLCFSAEW